MYICIYYFSTFLFEQKKIYMYKIIRKLLLLSIIFIKFVFQNKIVIKKKEDFTQTSVHLF